MKRSIVGFRQDDEGHWVALLACGHRQHMRHEPPFVSRPWVETEEGRASRIGAELDCPECEAPGTPETKAAPLP